MWRVQGIDPTITQVLGAYVSAVASLAVADVLVLELNCAACLRNALLVLVVTPLIGKNGAALSFLHHTLFLCGAFCFIVRRFLHRSLCVAVYYRAKT